MALNKDYKDYSYNLGRAVAVVEIINGLPRTFASEVFDNALQKLPYQLKTALNREKHNLHKELIEPADVVLNHGELPSKPVSTIDNSGRYWIGYNHEKSYITNTYNGIYGIEETSVEHYTPEHIDVKSDTDNTIDDLKR